MWAVAERFANALEEAEKTRVELKLSMGKLLTDPDDIKALLMKRKQKKMMNQYSSINIHDLLDAKSKA